MSDTRSDSPEPLDRAVAKVLIAQGLAEQDDLDSLGQRGRSGGTPLRGSWLLAGAVAEGRLSRDAALAILELVSGATTVETTAAPGVGPHGTLPALSLVAGDLHRAAEGEGGTLAVPQPSAADVRHFETLRALFSGQRYALLERESDDRCRVLDRRFDRPVLLRLGDPRVQASFFREARVLAQLDHPSIPRVHDVGLERGRPFFTTDLAEGRSLPLVLADAERPALPALLRAFLSLAAALDHAHGNGVVHGEVEPASVSLGSLGRVWLDGWGRASALASARESVVAATSLPLPPPRSEARLAPERRGGSPGDERADVYGLGLVLQAMLAREGAAAPRQVASIARKAQEERPEERYARVADLQEDVRRFLDGRGVLAERPSLAASLARLSRRHPATAGVVGALALALGAILSLAGRSVLVAREEARRQGDAASASLEHAKRQTAEAERHEADATRAAAIARLLADLETAIGAAQTLALKGETDERVDGRFREADVAAQALLGAARRFADAAKDSGDPAAIGEARSLVQELDRLSQVKLGAARGDFWLRRAKVPRPDLALEAYDALSRRPDLEPEDAASAALGKLVAARRLVGRQDAVDAALARLARAGGNEADLALLYSEVVAVERQEARHPTVDAGGLTPREREVYGKATQLVARRPDLPIAHELFGRYLRAINFGHMEVQCQALHRASALDPADPLPWIAFNRTWVEHKALHAPWRWSGGYLEKQLIEHSIPPPSSARAALDPEPLLYVAEHLQRQNKAASLAIAERALAEVEKEPPSVRRSYGDPWARAILLRARARLASGMEPGDELERLDPPEALAGERRVLVGWWRLATGKGEDGSRELVRGLQEGRPSAVKLGDALDAVLDPRADAGGALAALAFLVPPRDAGRDGEVLVARCLLARASVRARHGLPLEDDLERARAQLTYLSRFGAVGRTALARARALAEPRDPLAHLEALSIVAEVNMSAESTEDVALDARRVLVERLRRLGAEGAAAQFDAPLDPVEEVWVRRDWMPAEAHSWRRDR